MGDSILEKDRDKNIIPMLSVYYHPQDYPNNVVIRRWNLKKEKMDPKVGLIISDIYNIKNMLPIERDLRSIYEI